MPKRPAPVSFSAAIRARRWRKEQAEVIIAAWKQSGLRMREFGEQHSLPLKRLQRWSSKLRREAGPAPIPCPTFLPVKIAPPKLAQQPASERRAMRIELPSGVCIELDDDFNATALRRLVQALEC